MENENQKTDVIYILLSQSKKLFMILRGCKDSIRETYRHHLKGRRLTTESFIKSISPERPCLFILEEIDSEEEANLLIVWLKILLDQGYVSCNHPDIIEQTEHLYIDNLRAYNKRNDDGDQRQEKLTVQNSLDSVHAFLPPAIIRPRVFSSASHPAMELTILPS